MTKRIIILLTAILTTVAATASDNINFMHLTVKDGLCHNQISNIIRDSRGFMWFATTHGLSRYDGYEFRNYLKSTSVNGKEEIPSTSIVDIQEDADGMLWIKFNSNQYFCFNPQKETLTKSTAILTEKYGIDEEPSEIYVDSRNDMWIKTKSGNMYGA
ncbi:two-component regulator propeller domain-containing protein [uncultured Duncaniella sp.]|uniref:ligand-binding sensor domain-containing protein n=2 Tax=uncultured Duncaniella sp. TaxID=2768039 RepID=UPI0034A08262